ncbi:hypothetical protein Fmac_021324 [Flemingia macrophylla]|uniref:Receptor-like serine/threonine-protein kinase n=1 Tax=Flemingia macrophylla TaxID=520843 RepID=A0ABD1LWI8_9FABA
MVVLCIHKSHLSHRLPPPSSNVDVAFVSVSNVEATFIYSDKLQLSQFVYVTYIDIANPLPFVLNLNPLPCCHPCVGNLTLLLQPPYPTQHHPFTLSSSKSKTLFRLQIICNSWIEILNLVRPRCHTNQSKTPTVSVESGLVAAHYAAELVDEGGVYGDDAVVDSDAIVDSDVEAPEDRDDALASLKANDSIHVFQSINDGKTLVSKGGKFELGFFSPGSSQKRYLGIWYKNIPIQTVVWIANRANPINDSSGILRLNSTGNLILIHNGSLVWYTNSNKTAHNPVVVLLDSGNLVIRNEAETDPEAYLWQSFDYPSDTALPEMKIGWDLRTGLERRLTSWKSPDDPSPGDVYWVVKNYSYPDIYTMKGTEKSSRFGPWNGMYFSGIPGLQNNTIFGISFVNNKNEVYCAFSIFDNITMARTVINQTGYISRHVWVENERSWRTYRSFPLEFCDTYGLCGPYGNCVSTQSQACQCLKGFRPKSPEDWISSGWSQGCVRNKPLSCKDKLAEGFVKFEGLKVSDTTHALLDENIGLEECRVKCLNNCSCMAYTNSNIRGGGSGCVMWFGDLIDMKQFETGGQDLYIRMDASDGYMAPEYAVDGLFSMKSDVFSFGVLVLEIICGRRNRRLYHTYKNLNLVGHAWTTWKGGKALELIDPNIKEACVISDVLRCLHISLLCVQQYPEDRPTMASIILMLESHMELVEPKEHGFIPRNVSVEKDLHSSQKDTSSTNNVTITSLQAR